jgi:hypothetical protein
MLPPTNHIIGFYLPFTIALLAFLRIIIKRESIHQDPRYGYLFLAALIFAIQLPITGIGGLSVSENYINNTKFVSVFPLTALTLNWIELKTKKKWNKISISWIYLGTFSSMAMADFILSYVNFSDFHIYGIGGAGYIDALLITPLISCIFVIAINKAYEKRNN